MTRAGAFLQTPNAKIATEIMQEWKDQKDEILPDTMPFTQIISTKLDRIERGREMIIISLLKYLDTDLVCYTVDRPQGLKTMQQERWEPFRQWFISNYGYPLTVTNGLQAIVQPTALHDSVKGDMQGMSDDSLTILTWGTGLCGSLVMALSFLKRKFSALEVYEGHYVEEDYKNSLLSEINKTEPFLDIARKQTLSELHALQKYMSFLSVCST